MQKKIESFEIWLYRRIPRISWKDKVTNEEVFRRIRIRQELMADVVRRNMIFLVHTRWKDKLDNIVVIRFVDGKRVPGRQRKTVFIYLSKITQKPPIPLLR